MTQEPANLVLEHLRYIRQSVDLLHDDMREVKERLSVLEHGQVALRRDMLSLEEAMTRIQASHDRHMDRTARIERRLDISDNPTSL